MRDYGMFKTTSKIVVVLALAALGQLRAQEAWILEMPNKYSDYLIKKAVDGDAATVEGIIEKIPDLISKNQIREIELITWKADGGKIHPKEMKKIDDVEIQMGSTYTSMGGTVSERRNLNIVAAATERNFNITLFGPLGKAWTPTFSFRDEKLTVLVLERSVLDGKAPLVPDHSLRISFDATAKGTITWYASESLNAQQLVFSQLTAHPANAKVTYGVKIFSSVRKAGDSLVRMEMHHLDPALKDVIVLNHNQANFKDLPQSSGPLNKETITIADKSVSSDGEEGTYSITLSDN